MESVWLASKLSTKSVGSRRELVANCVHIADADATKLDSFVASAVCKLLLSSNFISRIWVSLPCNPPPPVVIVDNSVPVQYYLIN